MRVSTLLIECVSCRKGVTEAQRVSCTTCPHCSHRGINAFARLDVIFVTKYYKNHNLLVLDQIKTTIFGIR